MKPRLTLIFALSSLLVQAAEADGTYHIQFGGEPKGADNFLAIKPGWNYVLRLYRPGKAILHGTWNAPEPKETK